MREIMQQAADLDAAAAHTIAALMRELARVDGDHPDEEALITAFEADLPDGGAAEPDLSSLARPGAREALLKSLALVAFADGRMSPAERAAIDAIAGRASIPVAEVQKAIAEVAAAMLSRFEGVHLFRDSVVQLGRELGLDEPTIAEVLG